MGETRKTNESDYRFYARPDAGRAGDWVEVVEDGAASTMALHRAAAAVGANETDLEGILGRGRPDAEVPAEPEEGAPGGELAGEGLPADGEPERGPGRRFRFNPYLAAGWAVMALVLAPGLLWVTGILRQPQLMTMVEPGTGRSVESPSAVIAMQLFQAGPFILLFGLLGAAMLLACHGLIHALNAGRPAPAAAGTGRGSRRP